jgi:hypothetical protein
MTRFSHKKLNSIQEIKKFSPYFFNETKSNMCVINDEKKKLSSLVFLFFHDRKKEFCMLQIEKKTIR